MDRFRELQFFVEVVDAGSFVGAATTLRSSKAVVSRLIQDLESRLGARLLHRTTRRLSLTEAGQDYYQRARQILAEVDEADAAASQAAGHAVGRLKLSVPLSFGIQHLASLWGSFLAQHPGIELDVTLSDHVVDLVEDAYDMVIRIARLPDSSLVSRKLTSTRLVICASPEYLAANGVPKVPEDIRKHQVIGYSYSAHGDSWQIGEVMIQTRPRFRANNGDTCRAAALDHQGIVWQPTFMVGDDLASGRLVELFPEFPALELGIYALYPSRRYLSGKVKALIEFLSVEFSDCRWHDPRKPG